MPKGLQGQKRKADVIGNAVHVFGLRRRDRAGVKALALPHQKLRCSECPLLAQSGPWAVLLTLASRAERLNDRTRATVGALTDVQQSPQRLPRCFQFFCLASQGLKALAG